MVDKLDEMKKMLETGKILPLYEVKFYHGIFTGKMVKPSNTKNDFKKFNKGDKVIVFNSDEFLKFYKGMEIILESIKDLKN